mgnify:CR=1 FL=1
MDISRWAALCTKVLHSLSIIIWVCRVAMYFVILCSHYEGVIRYQKKNIQCVHITYCWRVQYLFLKIYKHVGVIFLISWTHDYEYWYLAVVFSQYWRRIQMCNLAGIARLYIIVVKLLFHYYYIIISKLLICKMSDYFRNTFTFPIGCWFISIAAYAFPLIVDSSHT